MAFTSHIPISPGGQEQFPNTRFILGQKASWITLPRNALSLAPLMHAAWNPFSDLPLSECQPDQAVDFAGSLKSILRPYLPDGYPKVELAAEIAGLSV